jgi:hypothetical protein
MPALVTVHTLGVLEVYVTGNVELAVAARLKFAVFSLTGLDGGANVIVCPVRTVNDWVTAVAAT